MASETVRKIEQAENAASEKIAEAQTIANQIIEKAKAEASVKRDEIIANARAEASRIVGESEADFALKMKNAENKREEISKALRESASKNENEIFDAVKEILIP